ncbi:MAG: FAD-dependent oxidoreductase [Clostridiales bacterium]|nr:FAD-dependent oxidoreductase [Clostridiales bacterium]
MIPVHSLWPDTVQLPSFEPLRSDIKTDILIIGGGLAGILCAFMLQNAGVAYALVEERKICSGVTKNTTAKITVQHGLFCDQMLRTLGAEKTQMYLKANQQALDTYRQLCAGIDCDFEAAGNAVYSLNSYSRLDRELSALHRLGVPAVMMELLPLPMRTFGAVSVPNQAQFNPLKFIAAIAKELHIYEHTPVLELAPGRARTAHGVIHADCIIVATHFPMLNKHGSYFLKLYQHRSYVLALKNASNVQDMYVDEADKGLSFRSYGDLLLLGGGSHRTGKKGGGWKELHDFARLHYSEAQVVCQWATQDCMTLDSVPYIGQYAKHTPGLYVFTGFNKWGMTNAMAGAILLRDLLLGKQPDWASVFSPSRSMLHPQLAINAAESSLGLLTPTVPRCPHMGCALKYNPQEHSWDCPCHGSRFTNAGKRINNPATGDMKEK